MQRNIKLSIVSLLLAANALLWSGEKIVYLQTDLEEKTTNLITVYIDKNKLRTDMKNKDNITSIFRKDKNLFWTINHKNKTYTELTKEDLDKFKTNLKETYVEMEKQLEELPPKYKELAMEMMKAKLSKKVEIPKYKKVASRQKINRWICDKYEGYLNDEKIEDVWTTDYTKLGIDIEVYHSLMMEMSKFIEGVHRETKIPIFRSTAVEKEDTGLRGFPVKIVSKDYKTEVKEVKTEKFLLNLFEVPKGYKKEKAIE